MYMINNKMASAKKKTQKNRKIKVVITFNEQERREFLKGFRKRKDERRQKAKEKFENDVKEERKRIKQKQKEMYENMLRSQRTVPEVEHLVEPIEYSLPSHTVTVSSIKDVDIAGHNNQHLGLNNDFDADVKQTLEGCKRVEDVKKKMKNKQAEEMKSSKSFEAKKKMQSKKDRQKSKKNKRKVKTKRKKVKR